MEDKVIQQSFTFKNSDRMIAQAKKTATNIQKRKWQVKEMEEDYLEKIIWNCSCFFYCWTVCG